MQWNVRGQLPVTRRSWTPHTWMINCFTQGLCQGAGLILDSRFAKMSKSGHRASVPTDHRWTAPSPWCRVQENAWAQSVFPRKRQELQKSRSRGHFYAACPQANLCNRYCLHQRWHVDSAWDMSDGIVIQQAQAKCFSQFGRVKWPGSQIVKEADSHGLHTQIHD